MYQREGERVNRGEYSSQSWVVNSSMAECRQVTGYLLSINSYKHLPQNPFTGKIFYMTTFCIDFYESYLSTVHTNKNSVFVNLLRRPVPEFLFR